MVDLVWGGHWAAELGDLARDIRDMLVIDGPEGPVLVGLGGAGGATLSFALRPGGGAETLSVLPHTAGLRAGVSDRLQILDPIGEGTQLVVGASATAGLLIYDLDDTGQVRGLRSLAVDGQAVAGDPVLSLSGAASGSFLYMMTAEGSLGHFRPDGDSYHLVSEQFDDSESYLRDPVALMQVSLGGQGYVLALCEAESGVTAYQMDATSGALTLTGAMGAFDGLGVLQVPQALEVVTLGNRVFVLVGSAAAEGQAGALSVMELTDEGALQPVDHVLDNLHSRFGNLQDMAVVEANGRAYVAVAGGDDGVSLFTLLPDGRLLHLDTLAGSAGTALMSPQALTAAVLGDQLQVFLSGGGLAGLSQLTVDLGAENQPLMAAQGLLAGGGGNDLLLGGSGDNEISGGWGHDILLDGAGADRLTGGGGGDRFVLEWDQDLDVITDFRAGQDSIDLTFIPMLYSASQVQITSTSWGARLTLRGDVTDIYSHNGTALSAAQIEAGLLWGVDRPVLVLSTEIRGGSAGDQLTGDGAADVMNGFEGDDLLAGLAGNDTLLGGAGNDTLLGGTGRDEVRGGLGADRAELGSGDDIFFDEAEAVGDHVFGESGNDSLYGGGGADTFSGGDGEDLLAGGAGEDLLDGGAGDDQIAGDDGGDVILGGAGADRLEGGADADSLSGGAGDDLLLGGGGFDQMAGGAGEDRLYGGDGEDSLWGDAGADHLLGEAGNDQIWGDDGADTLSGADGADQLTGGAGADRLEGGTGADTLWGGDDLDLLMGGSGDDRLYGGAGADQIWGHLGRDQLYGGEGADTLSGGVGADDLAGGTGNDVLSGGLGADRIHGGRGHDTVYGGKGADRVWLNAGADVFYDLGQGGNKGKDRVSGGAGNDRIYGRGGADHLDGQRGRDHLEGGRGQDRLIGGGGNDTLVGGTKRDHLTGGAGADVFVFQAGAGRDVITDFGRGNDRLHLDISETGFSQLTLTETRDGLRVSWDRGQVLLEGLDQGDLTGADVVFL